MPPGTLIPTETRNLILQGIKSGKSAYRIASEVDLSRSSVQNIINLYKLTGSVHARSRATDPLPNVSYGDGRGLHSFLSSQLHEPDVIITTSEWQTIEISDDTCISNLESTDNSTYENPIPEMADDAYYDESSNDNRMSLRERTTKVDKRLRLKKDEMKFLQDFNPEKSNRERRKIVKRYKTTTTNSSKLAVYDAEGVMRSNGLDLCDCLNDECIGCWTECSCGSTKCGPTCRSNRKFMYEEITFDGKDSVIKNKYFTRK